VIPRISVLLLALLVSSSPAQPQAPRVPKHTAADRPSDLQTGQTTGQPSSRGRVGDSAPDLVASTLEGARANLMSLRGRVVLLNLWATWCLPCLKEMPELSALHQQYEQAGLVVIGMNLDDPRSQQKAIELVAQRKLPFTIWLDPEMLSVIALSAERLPTTVLVDREGIIVWRRTGALRADGSALQRALRNALAQP
jgi:thiol-disulfide isomerase/thioredoxin